jgi:hypothetical protein
MAFEFQRAQRIKELLKLKKEGFEIVELTPYQFRVNERLDIYPTRAKWHDVRLETRGDFLGVKADIFVKKYFNEATVQGAPIGRKKFIANLKEIGWTEAEAEKVWKERQ